MKYLLLFILTACTPLTEIQKEQRVYRHFTAQENWINCQAIYERAGVMTVHDHDHSGWRKIRTWDYESDLRRNDCKRLLGDAWADH